MSYKAFRIRVGERFLAELQSTHTTAQAADAFIFNDVSRAWGAAKAVESLSVHFKPGAFPPVTIEGRIDSPDEQEWVEVERPE